MIAEPVIDAFAADVNRNTIFATIAAKEAEDATPEQLVTEICALRVNAHTQAKIDAKPRELEGVRMLFCK